MVGVATTFGGADYTTPHGGPPFHYWKRGYGFGHAAGAGGSVQNPACPQKLRFTPSGDRGYASSPFWRRKSELGTAASFGIGDRPDMARGAKDGSIAPDNYGDVSRVIGKTRRSTTRSGIKLKPRFPSIEQRYLELSWPKSGPGPAKYNTSNEPGTASNSPAWTCQPRGLTPGDLREAMAKPGPPDYEVRAKVGENSPIKHGTLYNISMRGRIPQRDVSGDASPGPAKYNLRGAGGTTPMPGQPMEQYGLDTKISNVRIPKEQLPRNWQLPKEVDAEVYDHQSTSSMEQRLLTRVDSSPL